MLSPALSEADNKAIPRLEEVPDIFTDSRALPAKNKAGLFADTIGGSTISGIARFPVSLISHCGQTGIETGKGLARQDFPASRRNALGYTMLKEKPIETSDKVFLYCKGKTSDAKGYVSTKGFTVMKGARVSDHVFDSLKKHMKLLKFIGEILREL